MDHRNAVRLSLGMPYCEIQSLAGYRQMTVIGRS